MFRKLVAAAAVSIGVATPLHADHWLQTADPQVLQALNELIQVYGNACQQGNQQGCQITQLIQQQGGMMLNAGYDCQMQGNQQACQFYNQAYGSLEQAYYQTQQAMQQGQYAMAPQGYNDGSTHAQRMQEIHNWGQQRLQWGQQQQQMMDNNHQQFLEYLRQ